MRLRYWGVGGYQEFPPSSSPPLRPSPFSSGTSVVGGLSGVGGVAGLPVPLPVVVCGGGEGGEALVVVGGETGEEILWGLDRRLTGCGGWRGVVG